MTDSPNLIERLRQTLKVGETDPGVSARKLRNPDGPEAAAEIARLQGRVESLREAVADCISSTGSVGHPDPVSRSARVQFQFYGDGSAEKAHRLFDAIAALLNKGSETLA